MILLDENVDVLVRRRLRDWRIRFKHIGTSVGRRGMKDVDEILFVVPPSGGISNCDGFVSCSVSDGLKNNSLGIPPEGGTTNPFSAACWTNWTI